MKWAFALLVFVASSAVRAAEVKTSAKAAVKSLIGVVVVEGAQIYREPDLDAPVIAVAKLGTRLPLSKGTRGEFAKFHRTRIDGKVGWIVTLDVKSEAEAKKVFTQARAAAYKRGPFADDANEDGSLPAGSAAKEPFVFTRNVSFALGWMNGYKESINGRDQVADLVTYGVKLTGPDVLLGGALMDVNVMLHYGAPDYYQALSSTSPRGFILWTDANLLLPIRMRDNSLIGLGAGPLVVMSNIQASQGGQSYSMWQVNLGLNLELTAGFRFGDFSVRLDGRYMFEKKTYRQAVLSVGTVF